MNLRTNINEQLVNKSRKKTIESTEQYNNKQIVFNLSKRKLTSTEESVLSKGLKYGIKNKKINDFELLTRFECLAWVLMEKEEFIKPNKDHRKTQLDSKTAFLHQLQSSAFEFLELTKTAKDNLTEEENITL